MYFIQGISYAEFRMTGNLNMHSRILLTTTVEKLWEDLTALDVSLTLQFFFIPVSFICEGLILIVAFKYKITC